VQGNAPLLAAFEASSVGELEVIGPPPGTTPAAIERILGRQDLAGAYGGAIEGLATGDLRRTRATSGRTAASSAATELLPPAPFDLRPLSEAAGRRRSRRWARTAGGPWPT
jgi:hypothetical protein